MSRFASLNDDEILKIVDDNDSRNTKQETNVLFNVLVSYCKEKNIALDEKHISKENLNNILSRFYTEVRKCDGTMYKQTSFRAIRLKCPGR